MISKIKKTIFISLLFPSILFADDKTVQTEVEKTSAFGNSYNAVYRFINNHDYLIAPISGAMAGGVRCGYWCAAAGGAIGAIDEASIYFGYTDKHYLTWGVFGIKIANALTSSTLSDIGGFAVGVLLPMGKLTGHTEAIAPMLGAVAGKSRLGGVSGLALGGAAGVLDELLIYNNITQNHYATFSALGITAANLLGLGHFGPVVADSIGLILGSLAANYEKSFTDPIQASVKTTKELYETYGKFMPKKQLDNHIEKQALALFGSQFVVQALNLKIAEHYQNMAFGFQHLNDANREQAWGGFTTGAINFAIFLFPYVIGETVANQVNGYFSTKLQYAVGKEIRGQLYWGEIPLRLSQDQNVTVAMDNLRSDISVATGSGSGLVTSAVSASIGGVYGVGIMVVSSPNLVVYSILYNQAQLWISAYLAEQQSLYSKKITSLGSEIGTITKDDAKNIRTITERDGVNFTKMRLEELTDDLVREEMGQELWGSVASLWGQVSNIAEYILMYYLVGNEINQGRLPFNNREKVRDANWQVSGLFSWSKKNTQTVSLIDQSLGRIVILEGKMRAKQDGVDQINRVTEKGDQLILQNLEVGVENKLLVSIKDLKLDLGKIYGITGDSGSGKTSLLSKIKGVKENGVSGKGNIYYPLINDKEPRILMLSQQDYFPINISLQQLIYYPEVITKNSELKNDQRAEMLTLLREIGLNGFATENSDAKNVLTLDTVKNNWTTHFSGGEKKKLLIISAVIKKPDILMLDEVFNGLDSGSIAVAERMLKKYLPNTLMLVVDHHAEDNNYNGFYDQRLHFSEGSIVVRDIPSKENPSS